jgi:thiamine biosynthesis lipoprotein
MSSSSRIELRRCRPLLGTFVEISARGRDTDSLSGAVAAAFESVERVQRLMSIHDENSELSQINRLAHSCSVRVGDAILEVLERGLEIARRSGGAFDFTIGAALAEWGLLPGRLRRFARGDWRDVSLLPGNRVRLRRAVVLDLGGIAKGYAVDCALRVLREGGATAGAVNAGGDLGVFGGEPLTVHLRHPAKPEQLVNSLRLNDAALATSSPCFTRCRWRGRTVSHLVNASNQSAVVGNISVSVRAKTCWLADALTKVVLNAPAVAERLLGHYDAEAYVQVA